MEKVFFRNSRGLELAGIFHEQEKNTNSIIIMVHGSQTDKDSKGVFTKVAEELCKLGFAVFRFDFSGHGESDDAFITVENLVDDLKSAINLVKDKGYKNIGIIGYSIGGLASVLCCDKNNEDIKTMVLIAPITDAKTPTALKDERIRRELNEKGFVIVKNPEGRQFRIDKKYLEERESINQKEILSKVSCPVLIIHGDKDTIVPVEHSKNAIKCLKNESKLEIIKDGDHILNKEQFLYAFGLTVQWFKKYL